jgi:FtsH-binding integral membrane protein
VNDPARAFRITVWIGVLVNFALGLTALFAPNWLLDTMGFQEADPDIWPRFAAWLLMLLTLFYVPGANDIDRYRANAVLSVFARFAGVVFFTSMVVFTDFSARYLIFGLIDLVFAVPSAVFLWLATRARAP